jgi:hypothetical protein
MRGIFIMALLAIPFVMHAQTRPSKFGEVPIEEMNLKRCPSDTAAGAMILFDKGECTLDINLRVTFKRHTRIKFFSQSAIDTWANRTIYLDKGEESLSKLKAVTYNLENGKMVTSELNDESVFKTKFDKWTNQVKFTLPNAKEGSVIEYSYTISTSAGLLPGWQFQYTIPNAWSEYQVYIPKTFEFTKDVRGFLTITEHNVREDGSGEKFIIKNVPAFKDEPYTLNSEDYISRINFYLKEVFVPGQPIIKFNSAWPSIVKNLLEQSDFGGQIRGSNFLKQTVEEITAGQDDQKKVETIYSYVKTNVAWNKIQDAIPDRPFKKVLEEKKGSSSEINLLLVSMMQKCGLNADPLLLSTRAHGMIRPFRPRFNQFNYVICMVKLGDKKLLIDATDVDLPMKALPERCLNGEGLVVSEKEIEWVPLVSVRSKRTYSATFSVSEEGEIGGDLSISTDGISAREVRSSFKELGQEKYVKEFLSGKPWEVTKNNFENIDNPSLLVKENYSLTVKDHAQATGSVIYLNPYLCAQMTDNIFKSETRLYPVDFSTPFEQIYMAKISLPDNYSLDEAPKPRAIALPNNNGRFFYSVTQNGSVINFVSQLIVNKSVFLAEEYPQLKEFYNQIISKQAEQIVFKKK